MNGFDLSTASNIYIGDAQASAVYIGSTKIWPGDESTKYFTIHAHSNCYVTCNNRQGYDQAYYSLDDGDTWIAFPAYSSSWKNNTSLPLSIGDEVIVKCTQTEQRRGLNWLTFNVTGRYSVKGNVMSLLDGDNFRSSTSTRLDYAFHRLFYNDANLYRAASLVMPATTLTGDCYANMFEGCTQMTAGPELPATTLAQDCYYYMFSRCTSITQAALPAQYLTTSCYFRMFYGCSNFKRLHFAALDISPYMCVRDMLTDTWTHPTATIHIPSSATYDTSTFVPSNWYVVRF